MAETPSPRRTIATLVALTLGSALLATPVAAHGGSLGASARESLAVPTWLFLLTGGGAVGGSFLLASFVTDRAFIARIHGWRATTDVPLRRVAAALVQLVGVLGLGAILVVGYLGPPDALGNLAILLVWVGWWAGFTVTTYLVGNAWPLLNPWRTLSRRLPSLNGTYPTRLGAWPSVAGLLVLIWLEVVSPLADDPRLLATVVAGYSVVTLAGVVAVGPDRWFGSVDPVARVFRYYGRVAPLSWDGAGDRLSVRLPGTALTESRLVDGFDEVAFVVALLWVTTYDGFVSTPAWTDIATVLVGVGVPAWVLYPATLLVGYALFLSVFRIAVRLSRRTADTYRTSESLAVRFAPSLLPIAAGYHLAHYLDYFLSLSPALLSAVTAPLAAPATVQVLQVPGWFGGVSMALVLLGHLLAIWVAHATAYDVFPGRLQAVRSQYPLAGVMVCYTVASLWIITQPTVTPPFL